MTCADGGSSHPKSRISSIGLFAADLHVTGTRGPDVDANCLRPCRTL
jgi:hypothetical protein